MRIEAISDTGLVRKGNEDSFLINQSLGLFAVADGMGGHEAGEIASYLAVKTLEQVMKEKGPGENALAEAIKAANLEIYRQSQERSEWAGMGTTLTAVHCVGGRAVVGHVGDSRAYLIHNSHAQQITVDHSLVNELVQSGQISKAEAENHPHRNIVTRALGIDSNVDVDIHRQKVEQGDILFLCTDGLSNLVKAEEIVESIEGAGTPFKALESLKRLALERGGFDNLTALLIQF